MSTGSQSPEDHGEGQPSEEELRAAYEAQIRQIRIEHVLLEDVVTLINLGMRRTGLVAGTEEERDPDQVRLAIEAVRAVLPLLEQAAPAQVGQVRDALSQLQLAYVRIGGSPAESPPPAGGAPSGSGPSGAGPSGGPGGGPSGGPSGGETPGEPEAPEPGAPGPAQRSGRLWVPGQ